MNTPIEFHVRIAHLRFKSGLGQKALAKTLHVTHQTIINWEMGETFPGFWNLVEIAKFFNTDLNWLVGHNIAGLTA